MQVSIAYHVDAIDVAYAAIMDDGTVFVRVVNGHAEARDVTLSLAMMNGTERVENVTSGPSAVTGGANHLIEWGLTATYAPDTTYRLTLDGAATGGPDGTETFATWRDVSHDGTHWASASPPTEAGRASGGGAAAAGPTPSPPSGGPPSGGGGKPPVLTYPLPEPTPAGAAGEDRSAGGDTAAPHGASTPGVLPPGLETLLDSITFSMIAAAIALVAGTAVFLARARFLGP